MKSRTYRGWWIGLPIVVAACCAAATGSVLAGTDGTGAQASEQEDGRTLPAMPARFRDLCSDGVCTVAPGRTRPTTAHATAAEQLAEHGTPATQCPNARAAYAEVGMDVHAFLGPCPTPNQVQERVALLDPQQTAARFERGLDVLGQSH